MPKMCNIFFVLVSIVSVAATETMSPTTCKAAKDGMRKATCCVDGKLASSECKKYGGPDKLPDDCKNRCFTDGAFKADDEKCVHCRGKGDLRAVGDMPDPAAGTRPFDPARVKDTIQQIAEKTNEAGEKCVKRVAQATSKLKTLIEQWRNNNPSQKAEPKSEIEDKALAEVQAEIDETAESSKKLENDFEGANLLGQLKKISEASKPQKEECDTKWFLLKQKFNTIVDDYSNLPQKLSGDVEPVLLKFSDTDIGRTVLDDSKSLCTFAGRFVSQLKKAENNHKKRLSRARKVLCTNGGELLKRNIISDLSNCLRKDRRDTNNDDDVQKFDKNARKRVLELLGLMKKKCLMKATPLSKPGRMAGVFKEKLKATITKSSGIVTANDKKEFVTKVNAAVQKKYSGATNIVTTVTDGENKRGAGSDGPKRTKAPAAPKRTDAPDGPKRTNAPDDPKRTEAPDTPRRTDPPGRAGAPAAARPDDRARRALATNTVNVETTWDSDTPAEAAGKVTITLGDGYSVEVSERSAQSTGVHIQGSEPIEPIDTELPDGKDSDMPGVDDESVVMSKTGSKEVVFGTATVICAVMWVF